MTSSSTFKVVPDDLVVVPTHIFRLTALAQEAAVLGYYLVVRKGEGTSQPSIALVDANGTEYFRANGFFATRAFLQGVAAERGGAR
jgi:hypothetical protein